MFSMNLLSVARAHNYLKPLEIYQQNIALAFRGVLQLFHHAIETEFVCCKNVNK